MQVWHVDCEQNVYSKVKNSLKVRGKTRKIAFQVVLPFCYEFYLSFTVISTASDSQVEQHTNLSVCLWFIGEGVKG